MKDQIKPIENDDELETAKEHLDTIDISLADKRGADGKKKKVTNEYAEEKLRHEAIDIERSIKDYEDDNTNQDSDTFKKNKSIKNENELKATKKHITTLKDSMSKSISQSEMKKAVFHQSALLQEQQQLIELQRLVKEYENKKKLK